MDLSALIFVALAVAWATYLIPKALRHHEDSSASRSVEGFSGRLRVLARREPVDSKSARLVVPGKPARVAESSVPAAEALVTMSKADKAAARQAAKDANDAVRVEDQPEIEVDLEFWAERRPAPPAVRRAAAAQAARRRLRVVLAILTAGVVVGVTAALGQIAWVWLAVPGVVLLAWLVACRLMVKRERSTARTTRRLPLPAVEPVPVDDEADPSTEEIAQVEPVEETEPTPEPVAEEPAEAPRAESAGWDPVPTTLPTYVAKEPAARRSVRTIDLDATGVWTSGPLAADSALAREAEAERKTRNAQAEQERRAAGS
ncbi:MAG: hypothetical protein JWN84_984 [Nocardioides sp.]|nr:hypothetical protein [Nocardioides sp.]